MIVGEKRANHDNYNDREVDLGRGKQDRLIRSLAAAIVVVLFTGNIGGEGGERVREIEGAGREAERGTLDRAREIRERRSRLKIKELDSDSRKENLEGEFYIPLFSSVCVYFLTLFPIPYYQV